MLAKRHEIVMVEQGRHDLHAGRIDGARSGLAIGERPQFVERPSAFRPFEIVGLLPEHGEKRPHDEGLVIGARGNLLRDPRGDRRRRVLRKGGIGKRERLLRHDALVALVASHRVGRVVRYDLNAVLASIAKAQNKKEGDKGGKDGFGDLARALSEFFCESQRTVGLGVGMFARTNNGVNASATSDGFKGCLQGARKNEQWIERLSI